MKRTQLPLAALAVALSTAAAACGDDSPSASSDDGTTEAADTTGITDTTVVAETTEPPVTTGDPESTVAAPEAGAEPTIESATPVVVGLPEAEAAVAADALGWEVRVTRVDGEDQAATMDFRPNRVNVAVEDGEVTEVLGVG